MYVLRSNSKWIGFLRNDELAPQVVHEEEFSCFMHSNGISFSGMILCNMYWTWIDFPETTELQRKDKQRTVIHIETTSIYWNTRLVGFGTSYIDYDKVDFDRQSLSEESYIVRIENIKYESIIRSMIRTLFI